MAHRAKLALVRAARIGTVAAVAATAAGGWPGGQALAGADRPDTLAGAKHAAASPAGAWLRETLGSRHDRDFFRFTTGATGRALVTLGALPADYALAVFDADGHRVATADRGGRRFEQVYVALPAGDHYVRVTSSKGAADPRRAYQLRFDALPQAVVFAEHKDVARGDGIDIRGELLNNTPHRVEVTELVVRYYDKHGQQIGSSTEGIRPGAIAPRGRAEFEVKRSNAQLPKDMTTYRIRVHARHAHDPVLRGAHVTAGSSQSLSPRRRLYQGTVTNTTDHALTNVWVTVIEYDSRGQANAMGFDHIRTLAAGATAKYSLVARFPHRPNATRSYATVYG